VSENGLFIEVNRIPRDGLAIDRALELQPLAPEDGPVPVSNVRIAGQFLRSRNEVVFRGKVEAVLSLLCSRCAAPTEVGVSGDCHRVFRSGPMPLPTSEGEIEEEDLALTPFDGFHIDLPEIAREQIYLLLPLKPLCRETCAGLCPRCGANRNLEPCGCSEDLQGGDPLTLKMPF
jgi:uncharacterized protein